MFLSVVSKSSKPSASAAAISSPFTRRSHPRSMASTTMCPFRASRSGAGVPLSKSMSIEHLKGGRDGRRVQASRREFDHGYNLFMRQVEPLHHLGDRGSYFQIVEDDRNRRPRVPEYPRTAALAGDALYGGALRPIESCHLFPPSLSFTTTVTLVPEQLPRLLPGRGRSGESQRVGCA